MRCLVARHGLLAKLSCLRCVLYTGCCAQSGLMAITLHYKPENAQVGGNELLLSFRVELAIGQPDMSGAWCASNGLACCCKLVTSLRLTWCRSSPLYLHPPPGAICHMRPGTARPLGTHCRLPGAN